MSKTTESIRWRGGQVTRIEALTDAVFGFAITLLIVSLEVPSNYNDLTALMLRFVPFAFAFAALILVWWYHYQLFSRYDLEDGYTVVLNSILLFVVLFYVYPLKFVASFLFSSDKGGNRFRTPCRSMRPASLRSSWCSPRSSTTCTGCASGCI